METKSYKIARAGLATKRGIVEHWSGDREAACLALERLEREAGALLVADPSQATALAGQIRDLRGRIELAGRTIETAEADAEAAQREVWGAQARDWDAEAARRRTRSDAHDARTRQLLTDLREHDEIDHLRHARNSGPGLWVPEPGSEDTLPLVGKGARLRGRVQQAVVAAGVARQLADGGDPMPELYRRASAIDGRLHGLQPEQYLEPLVPMSSEEAGA